VAFVTLVLWVITAAAGVSLLATGGAARRRAAAAQAASAVADAGESGSQVAAGVAAEAVAGTPAQVAHAIATAPAATAARRYRAVPLTPEGKPPPVPRVHVPTPAGEHPLLEFSHPALAVAGLACWFMFTFVHYLPMAWISFGILIVAMALGVTWLIRNRQAAREHASSAWGFPPRLILAHGLGAGIGIALAVLTALTASHG
jgi:Flp pilus assembly protein TadB